MDDSGTLRTGFWEELKTLHSNQTTSCATKIDSAITLRLMDVHKGKDSQVRGKGVRNLYSTSQG